MKHLFCRHKFSVTVMAIACVSPFLPSGMAASGGLNVLDFGAKGDGATKDTRAIQAAIDKASSSGGGAVIIPPGKYVSGTIHLRSNLTLQIEQGAVLIFSPDDEDFDPYEELPYHIAAAPQKTESQLSFVTHITPERRRHSAPPAYDDTETTYFHYALLSGDGVSNVTIQGTGTIEGNRPRRGGPKPIGIKNSEWISVRGITIRNAPNYNVSFAGTDHIEVEGVKLINGFADGLDFDGCHYVRVANCDIDAWDDAICPKASWALGKPRSTEHLVVTNCVLRTSCNHFKFGTETAGDLRDVAISNCVMLKRDKGRKGLGGIALESVDGAHIDGVVVSNISMEDVISPVFIRLGARGRGMDKPAPGSIRNISIQNVIARRAMLASTITGIVGGRIQNVTINGLNVTAMGGVAARDFNVPEVPAKYPDPDLFGELPALAMFARHVDGLNLQNIEVHSEEPDGRPALVLDDVTRLQLTGFDATNRPPHQPLVRLENVAGALIFGNRLSAPADFFLSVTGSKSAGISLEGNDLRLAHKGVQQGPDVPGGAVLIEDHSSLVH